MSFPNLRSFSNLLAPTHKKHKEKGTVSLTLGWKEEAQGVATAGNLARARRMPQAR